MKCPHLLSHEMTGQVDSSALDQFLSSPHAVSYPAVVSSCSAELCFVLGKDGLRYRLRTPCNSEHSVFIGQYSNKWTTYHSATEFVSRHTSHTVHEKIGTTFNTGLSETSHVQFASGIYIAYLAGKLLHAMDVHVVFHLKSNSRQEKSKANSRQEKSIANGWQSKLKDCDRDKARYEEKYTVQSEAAATYPTSDADVHQQSIQSASQSQMLHELKLDEEITTIRKIDFDEEIVEYEKIIPTAQKQRFRKSRRP